MNFSEMAGKACVCSCSGNCISPHSVERRKFSSQVNSSTRIQTRNPRLFPPGTLSTRINAIGGVSVPRKLRLAPKCFNYLVLFLKNFKLKINNWRRVMLSSACWEKNWLCAWKGTVLLFPASKWFLTFSFWVMKSWPDSLGQLAQELPGTKTRQVHRLATRRPWRTSRAPRQRAARCPGRWWQRCQAEARGGHARQLHCSDAKTPVALEKLLWFVSYVVHVKNFPTVIDFSCQDQGDHVQLVRTAPAQSSGAFFYPFSFLLNNYWGS